MFVTFAIVAYRGLLKQCLSVTNLGRSCKLHSTWSQGRDVAMRAHLIVLVAIELLRLRLLHFKCYSPSVTWMVISGKARTERVFVLTLCRTVRRRGREVSDRASSHFTPEGAGRPGAAYCRSHRQRRRYDHEWWAQYLNHLGYSPLNSFTWVKVMFSMGFVWALTCVAPPHNTGPLP